MPEFDTFAKALMAFFSDRKVTVSEVRELTPQDRAEFSEMLNAAGFTHPPYDMSKAAAEDRS